ncbi:hypothetical protein [Chromobacterium sphagni]|uniref:hypothetical protein n=1 Tax=Chromobacterium sphagni TaxID=1903179 RepID=UPI001113B091|nr:hypothetical protein [Chromobacterium sphagni]
MCQTYHNKVWITTLALITTLLSTLSHNIMAQEQNCKALVEYNRNLWLSQPDGTLSLQLTHDGKKKFAIGISPTGKIIAYDNNIYGGGVTLIDNTGKHLAIITPKLSNPIVGLDWINPNLLRIAEHLGPKGSKFHFINIPSSTNAIATFTEDPPYDGELCTPAPDAKNTACIFGGLVQINKSDFYSPPDPFGSATTLQDLSLVPGQATFAPTEPKLKVEVADYSSKYIQVQITDPDDIKQTRYARWGSPVSYSPNPGFDGSPPSTAVYGFLPTQGTRVRTL